MSWFPDRNDAELERLAGGRGNTLALAEHGIPESWRLVLDREAGGES